MCVCVFFFFFDIIVLFCFFTLPEMHDLYKNMYHNKWYLTLSEHDRVFNLNNFMVPGTIIIITPKNRLQEPFDTKDYILQRQRKLSHDWSHTQKIWKCGQNVCFPNCLKGRTRTHGLEDELKIGDCYMRWSSTAKFCMKTKVSTNRSLLHRFHYNQWSTAYSLKQVTITLGPCLLKLELW